jgi:hypothetical protein
MSEKQINGHQITTKKYTAFGLTSKALSHSSQM